MSKKRTNLAAALHEAGAKPTQIQSVTPVQETPNNEQEKREDKSNRAPSRQGLKAVTVYVKPEVHKQLRMMVIDQGDDRSLQDMMIEAINDLFKKYGKSIIA